MFTCLEVRLVLMYRNVRHTVVQVVHLHQHVVFVTCLSGQQEAPHFHYLRLLYLQLNCVGNKEVHWKERGLNTLIESSRLVLVMGF